MQFSIGDVLSMAKTVFLSVVATGVVVAVLLSNLHSFNVLTFVLDYFFLVSLVILSRFSFQVLNHLWKRDLHGGKRVLIYGASHDGSTVLTKILEMEIPNLSPVGFMDEDPSLEGKTLHGFPIFGGHWKLSRLIRTRSIDQIILANDRLFPEVMRRVLASAKAHNVAMRVFRIRLEDVSFDVHSAQQPQAFMLREQDGFTGEPEVLHTRSGR
jgi:FlaA1/EpsC-like NDP-sugar epimerase